jgi:RNase_H superfamily
MTADTASLERRLERWRAARAAARPDDPRPGPSGVEPVRVRAERLAADLGGEVVGGPRGTIVRIARPARWLDIDRGRLAALPGHPGPAVPLVFLDTETTGLGTAAGTFAFLVGLGWWQGRTFRQLQLLLPDQGDEPAFLDAVAAAIPPDGWLVTYNGRTFDWPLLETRFRLRRSDPPVLAGHLDLLPFVRRVFRHRLPDARLRSVERHVLGLERVGDVDGWEIPGRYLEVLRGGPARLLTTVVEHNHLDVLALAQLLVHVEDSLAAPPHDGVPAGDLAGLGRAYRRAGRPESALACVDAALEVADEKPGIDRAIPTRPDEPWWSPGRRPDLGGRPETWTPRRSSPDVSSWSFSRIATERARLLRFLGRYAEAVDAWRVVAANGGRSAIVAWIEIAKLREHRLADLSGALEATARARALAERDRHLGRPDPALDRAIAGRADRIRRRLRRAA